MSIAGTTVSAPPALVTAAGRLHLFWLDGQRRRSRLLHAMVDPIARTHTDPRIIAAGVDSRAGWPVAAAAADRVAVAWMSAGDGKSMLTAAVLDAAGNVVRTPMALAPPAEESGRVAIIADADGWALAWSQFTNPARRVWFVRIDRTGHHAPPRALAEGDGAALAPGPRLFWWSPVGFDTYRLQTARVAPGPAQVRTLTGTISLPVVVPPIPVGSGDRVTVLLPIVQRGFATTGRLYALRVDRSGVSERVPITAQSVFDVTATHRGDVALAAWSAFAGPRRNSEIFSMLITGTSGSSGEVSRASLSTPGSLRPAVAPLGDTWAAAWLEAAGEERFELVLATASVGRPPTYLLGVPELDVRRPGQMLAYGAIVAASTLPYTAIFTAAFMLTALALQLLVAAIVGTFSFADALRRRRWLRFMLFLIAVVVLEIAARRIIPGGPRSGGLLLAMAVPAAAGTVVVVKTTGRTGEMAFWGTAAVVVAAQLIILLFPWGARLLSQY
ncbi:MAG TPA: hypothetical protein VGK88_09890 [bacterium]